MYLQMKRHLNRKKIDPKHVGFWKKLFASPFVVLLEREPGLVPGDYFNGHGDSNMAGIISMVLGHGNACILRKQDAKAKRRITCVVRRDSDIITAFYFPLIPGLRWVRVDIGGQTIGEWTPEGSEFRQPPLPLPAILDECRSLPTEIPWDRILKGCRSRADYPVIHHDFGRTIEIDGEKYRRAVLVHPCITLIGLVHHEIRLVFEFDEEQEFVFYQESWLLDTESRRHIAQNEGEFSVDSDTFADQSNEGFVMSGMFGIKYAKEPEISDLGRLLQGETDTQRAMVDLGALRDSARGSREPRII